MDKVIPIYDDTVPVACTITAAEIPVDESAAGLALIAAVGCRRSHRDRSHRLVSDYCDHIARGTATAVA